MCVNVTPQQNFPHKGNTSTLLESICPSVNVLNDRGIFELRINVRSGGGPKKV